MVYILARNLNSPNFWFDESGQFWLALGQNHFSPANTAEQSIKDVWINSKSFNLDPGGFTLLLRGLIYTLQNTTPPILRFLPLLFSIVLCIGLLFWGKIAKISIFYSTIAIFYLFLNENFLYYSLELRAYSMELCGVVFIFLATGLLNEKITRSSYLIWLTCLTFFGLSRYSFVIYEGAAFCAILTLQYFLKKSIDKSIFLTLGLTLLVFNITVYVLMLQYQTASASPPPYVLDLLLFGKDLNHILATLKINFFSVFAIPKTLFIFLYFICNLSNKKFKNLNPWLGLLFFYILYSTLIAMLLSFIGKLPWSMGSKWSLSELALNALAIIGILSIAKELAISALNRYVLTWISAILSAAILMIQTNLLFDIQKYDRANKEYEPIFKSLEFIYNNSSPGGTIALDKYLWPSYRYVVERSGLSLQPNKNINLEVLEFDKMMELKEFAQRSKLPTYFIYGAPWDESKKGILIDYLKEDFDLEIFEMDKYKHLRVIIAVPHQK